MSLQEIDLLQVTQVAEYEVEWALTIKAAVEADDEIQNVSDFEYVHHALIAKEDCEGAVERIRGLQYFREEYKITDSVEEGVQLLQQFLKQQENFLLTVDIDREKGHFVWVYDNAKIKPSAVRSPEDWRTYIGGKDFLFVLLWVAAGLIHLGKVLSLFFIPLLLSKKVFITCLMPCTAMSKRVVKAWSTSASVKECREKISP